MTEWPDGEMNIKSVEVKTFRQTLSCPQEKCNGEMKYNGMTYTSFPPQYGHTCDQCGYNVKLLDQSFPRTVTKEV